MLFPAQESNIAIINLLRAMNNLGVRPLADGLIQWVNLSMKTSATSKFSSKYNGLTEHILDSMSLLTNIEEPHLL